MPKATSFRSQSINTFHDYNTIVYTPVQELNLWKERKIGTAIISETLLIPPYMVWHGLLRWDWKKARQAREAVRVPELFVEQLYKLRKTRKSDYDHFKKAMKHWAERYFTTQQALSGKPYLLLYTTQDDKMPLRPESSDLYGFLMPMLVNLTIAASKLLPPEKSRKVIESVHGLNERAQDIFMAHPARVPRFTGHGNVALEWVQHYDDPLTACPSLHEAYATFAYNVGMHVLKLPEAVKRTGDKDLSDTLEALRTLGHGTTRTILDVKQHSCVDSAAGKLLARIQYEESFPGLPFDDLTDRFDELARTHEGIRYDLIGEDFDDLKTTYERAKRDRKRRSLVEILDWHIDERGYKRVPHDTQNVRYNRKTGEIEPMDIAA